MCILYLAKTARRIHPLFLGILLGLACLTKVIFEAGGNIISVGSFYGESSDTAEVTLKVDGVAKEKLEELVQNCVLKVVDIRERM